MSLSWNLEEGDVAMVYGLGLSGVAASRLLRQQGAEVLGVDRRPATELDLAELLGDVGFTLLAAGEQSVAPQVDLVVVSPGVPRDRPLLEAARRAGVPIIAEVELAYRFLDGPVIGITGSNGKSTTTALTGELLSAGGLRAEVCGNIGRPLSACVGGGGGPLYVTELSSFQLEGVLDFHPRAAALLNLSADHLDRHGDASNYAQAKLALFKNQTAEDVAVLNADDPQVATSGVAARRRFFSRLRAVEDGCFLHEDRVIEVAPGEADVELFIDTDLHLRGPHNLENAMAAFLLARSFAADPQALRRGLKSFRGLPHRLEWVVEHAGVTWYDDSKGTNPAATERSLSGFDDRSVHLILGGRSKGADLSELEDVVRRKAKQVYLIGESARELEIALGDVALVEVVTTLDRAVGHCFSAAEPGEAVLLSPACSSFDQFRDYIDRGRRFQKLVLDAIGVQRG